MMLLVALILVITYFLILLFPAPSYKLRPWDKQLIETVFVLLISWLAYVLRDDFNGLVWFSTFLISFLPLCILCWDCHSFGIVDYLMAHAFQAAALFTIDYPYAPVALAFGGVSLVLVKKELQSN